jgi:hypothetical protein
MESMKELMEKMTNLQKEMMDGVLKNSDDSYYGMGEMYKKIFVDPLSLYKVKVPTSFSNTAKIMENNMKFHTAFINYHTSIKEMMEIINENLRLLNENK